MIAIDLSDEDRADLHRCALELTRDRLPTGWEPVPSSGFARVAFNPEQQIYYKEFLLRSPADRLKALLRGSRATRARKHGDALVQAGFAAPQNIAWGKLPAGREYLVTRAADGQDVTQWLRTTLHERNGEPLQTRRHLLHALGTFIGRLHAAGFVHGDLRPGNVLATLNDGRFDFTLLDNERTVQKLPPPGRLLLKNLMQLNMLPPADLSRADRMRFFCAWRRQMPEFAPIEAKLLAAEAYHWAMRRMYEKGSL